MGYVPRFTIFSSLAKDSSQFTEKVVNLGGTWTEGRAGAVEGGCSGALEFPPCEELQPVESELERNPEQQRGPVGTERQRHSVSPIPISPSAAYNPHPTPPHAHSHTHTHTLLFHSPATDPVASQSAGSGACDVTVQSDLVRANGGTLRSLKRGRVCWADSNQARGRQTDAGTRGDREMWDGDGGRRTDIQIGGRSRGDTGTVPPKMWDTFQEKSKLL